MNDEHGGIVTDEDRTAITAEEDRVENRVRARKIFQSFGLLTTGKVMGELCMAFLFVVLARVFGTEGIGQYSFAMGLTAFFTVFSDFGLYNFTIKEISRSPRAIGEQYGRILLVRIILSIMVFAVLLLVLPFLPFSGETKLILLIIGAYQVIEKVVHGFVALCIAREDIQLAGLVEFSLRAVTALAAIAVVMSGGNLVMVVATLAAITFMLFLVAYDIVTKRYGRPRLGASLSSVRRTLHEAMPYAISPLLFQLHSRTAVVLLGFFLGAAAAGVYNAAYRMIFLLMFIPVLFGTVLFPVASRLYLKSRSELEALYHRSLNVSTLMGLPAAAGIWLTAPNLISLIFGQSFSESASVLRILAGVLFLACLNRIMGFFLMSCDRQRERASSQWTAAWVNVVANVLFIPSLGVKGAALAALISEALLVILYAVRLRVPFGWPRILSRLGIGAVGAASFCLPFALLPPLSMAVIIPASILLYSGTLVLFKQTRRNEIRTFLSVWTQGVPSTRSVGRPHP